MTADPSSPPRSGRRPAAGSRRAASSDGRRRATGRGREWLPALLAPAGGAVTALAFPPFDLGALALPGVVIGLAAMAAAGNARRGALVGWLFAAVWYAVLWSWLAQWGWVPVLGLAAGQALFLAPVGALAAVLPRRRPVGWLAGVSGAWTLADAARARWPLGGWEWGQLGYALHDSPARDAAALGGVLGLTFLVVATCAAAAVAITGGAAGTPRRRWLLPLAAFGVLVVAVAVGGRSWTADEGSLDIAIVQVQPPCPGRAAVDCPGEGETLLERFAAATARLSDDVDLVVWGEGAIGGRGPEEAGRVVASSVDGGLPAPLLTGVTSPAGPDRFHNRNVLLAPDGEVVDTYAKRHLVPFGEFVPARGLLGRLYGVGRLVPRDAVRGQEPGRLPFGDVTLGTVSSFEGSVARAVRAVGTDAAAITVLSTVTSYGQSPASDQFLAMNRLRAVELQRAVAVAATTGRSTVIAPDGSRSRVTDLMSADVLAGELELRSGATPYARFGDVPAALLAAALLAGGAAAGLRGARRRP